MDEIMTNLIQIKVHIDIIYFMYDIGSLPCFHEVGIKKKTEYRYSVCIDLS